MKVFDMLMSVLVVVCLLKFVAPLQTSELGITEHIAEDCCKFAVWTGEPPFTEEKRIIKVRARLIDFSSMNVLVLLQHSLEFLSPSFVYILMQLHFSLLIIFHL